MQVSELQVLAFVDACHRAARYGLVRYSSGNLSWRVDAGYYLVTASGSWLGELTADQVAICRLEDGACVNGKTPSVEGRFHRGVLQARSDMWVVLHFQTPCATAIACGDPTAYAYNVIPEMPVYIGTPGIVGYFKPGSSELAEAVIAAMKDHNLAFMRNHGLITVGRDFNETLQRAGFFELICEMLLSGARLNPLSAAALSELAGHTKA